MKFHIYRDRKGEYRWRLKAKNGRVIATSGEGYRRKRDCERRITDIRSNAPAIPVWEGK